MKKLVSILLAAVIVLGLTAGALAADGETASDYAGLVIDVLSEARDGVGGPYEYHIPKIRFPGAYAEQVNRELYDTLSYEIESSLKEIDENGHPFTSGGITYSWTVDGDILSLLVQDFYSPQSSGGDQYTVYNLSLSTGQAVSDEDVLAHCGYDENSYREAAEQAVRAGSEAINGHDDPMAEQCLKMTLSQDNMDAAQPFIRDNGDLCIACGMNTMIAAGYYYYLFDLAEGANFTYVPWAPQPAPSPTPEPTEVPVSTEVPASTDAPVPGPDDPGLVTDAFVYQGSDEFGPAEYRVPTINLPGAEAVNAQIWQDMYETTLGGDAGIESRQGNGGFIVRNMFYRWAVNGDVLSVWATAELDVNDIVEYFVYNVSYPDGAQLSDDELLARAGMDPDQFRELSRLALTSKFNALYGGLQDPDLVSFKEDQLAQTQSDENVQTVQPFLDDNGAMCVIGRIYSMAGAEYYCYALTLPDPSALLQATAAPAQPAGDSRLIYFIEHSDTQYFSQSDIAGFTEEMCNYARNGVYARSGRGFLDQDLLNYFLQFDWYSPDIPPAQFSESYLNDYQIKNIALVLAYEQDHGFM